MDFLGVEIGGTKLQVAVVAGDGTVRSLRHAAVVAGDGAEGILRALANLLAEACRESGAGLQAAGVGFGGPVDRARGTVATSHHVAGWDGVDLADWVSARIGGRPAFLENDSNAAALAEASVGAGRDARVVLYSNVGSGIGGGLVVAGRLHHGRPPGEMEIGHLRTGDGRILEDVASGWALDRQVADRVAADPAGPLARAVAAGLPGARALPAAIAAGDGAAAAIVDRAASQYALALSHAVHLLGPDVVVLGGGVAEMGSSWRDAVAGHMEPLLMAAMRPGPQVRLAALGAAAVPVGAALVAASGGL